MKWLWRPSIERAPFLHSHPNPQRGGEHRPLHQVISRADMAPLRGHRRRRGEHRQHNRDSGDKRLQGPLRGEDSPPRRGHRKEPRGEVLRGERPRLPGRRYEHRPKLSRSTRRGLQEPRGSRCSPEGPPIGVEPPRDGALRVQQRPRKARQQDRVPRDKLLLMPLLQKGRIHAGRRLQNRPLRL